jgi:CubicO group peptidase (beta-lactamase class C family)
MGILLIGEIVERCTGSRLRDLLRERLFQPLGMGRTVLGMPPNGMEEAALSLDAPFEPGSNDVGDDWNTEYWRDFGAPWGGLHSTVDDLSRFLGHILGEIPGPLSPALRRAMTSDQTARMPHIPVADKLRSRWGLGFALGSSWFGNLVAPSTFGHIGATGSLFWADPTTGLSCVLLTNQPRLWRRPAAGFELLGPRFSNAVAAAVTR